MNSGLSSVRFDLLAELAGLRYVKCETLEQFVSTANDSSMMRCLIEVMLEKDEYRGPSVVTKFDENGKPYSTDIAEVHWEQAIEEEQNLD